LWYYRGQIQVWVGGRGEAWAFGRGSFYRLAAEKGGGFSTSPNDILLLKPTKTNSKQPAGNNWQPAYISPRKFPPQIFAISSSLKLLALCLPLIHHLITSF
jgi:hypothetical protein